MAPFAIVVGSDFQPASGFAFDLAVRMALRIPRSQLHVVHVVGDHAMEAEVRQLVGLLRLYIQEKSNADSYAGQSAGIHVRRGEKARELAQLASDVSADVILLGPHGRGHLRDLLHGPLAARLQRIVSCPVLVAQPKPEPMEEGEPVIEPPCPDCLAVRERSAGSRWWCGRHETAAHRAHEYSYSTDLPFESHDTVVSAVDLAR